MRKILIVGLLCLLPFSVVQPQDDEIVLEILWYSDSAEDVTLRRQLNVFEQENPGIRVEITPESSSRNVNEILRMGDYPDIARTTTPGDYVRDLLDLRPYLTNPEEWDTNFPEAFLEHLRSFPGDDGLYGYPADITVSAPYINRDLWERAGVPIPSDFSDEVTWEDWTRAAAQVQAALTTEERAVYAIAIDPSGHRFWGPSLSRCAEYLDENARPIIDTSGFRRTALMLKNWHKRGLVPVDVWQGTSETRIPPDQLFIDSQVAFYFSGNWHLGKFDRRVDFDMEVVPNPVGECGSTGMIGGSTVVAFDTTEHPEEVGKVIDFLTQYDNLLEFYTDNLLLPGHLGMIEAIENDELGLPYADMREELAQFQSELATASPEAYRLQYVAQSSEIHGSIRRGLIRMLQEDLTIDETIEVITNDLFRP